MIRQCKETSPELQTMTCGPSTHCFAFCQRPAQRVSCVRRTLGNSTLLFAARASSNTFAMARWGLVPSWTKKDAPTDHYRMFNARSESVEEKGALHAVLRLAIKATYCVLPSAWLCSVQQ